MRPDPDKNFEKYLTQLVSLLKKMMKHFPHSADGLNALSKLPKESDPGMNVFVFNFLPVLPEELEGIEELLEGQLASEDEPEELSTELNHADVEFLRRHGIRF